MAQTNEYTARNIEKAIEQASQELGVDAEKIRYDVVQAGSSGIFGLVGKKSAIIKVHLATAEPETLPHAIDNEKISVEDLKKCEDINGSETEETTREEISLSHLADVGETMLRKIVDQIRPDASVKIETNGRRINYYVHSQNSGQLIGKHGQTLEAIHYLVEKVINKQASERIRVLVDVEGYRHKREKQLEEKARKLAQRAKKTGRPASFEPINAHDRRIVHIALQNDHRVQTKSVGAGRLRKLVIFPQKNTGSRRPRRH